MLRKGMFLAGLILACAGVQAAEPVPLADFARHMQFKDVKISPDGKHLAATAIVGGNVEPRHRSLASAQRRSLAARAEQVQR